MKSKIMLLAVAFIFAGCGWLRPEPIVQTKTIEVKVPVYLKAEPPAFLQEEQNFDLPAFQVPTSQGMSSCLNPSQEERLKRLLMYLREREQAWREWAK